MKKKAIEKVPYLGLKKTSRKKDVKYIGVTAVKNVAHERHFFLEVYENKKDCREIPIVRIVHTKKDFGTYFPEREEWSRQKLGTMYCSDGLIWESRENRSSLSKDQVKKNVLYDELDLVRIEKFFKDVRVYDKSRWWEYVLRKQDDIVCRERNERERRKYERRQQALEDRKANTPELPEAELLEEADRFYFLRKHYLYYKKRGNYAQIACSKCGGVTEARWRAGMSYESQFERHTEEPREGKTGHCPMCGELGEYKCQGKVRIYHNKTVYVFLGNRYKESGFVMRYIELSKKWVLEICPGEKGDEMHGAYEELSGVEIARAYFEEGKQMQMDFHKHNPYSGKDFWDDCNLYGMSNIKVGEGPVLYQTYEEMEDTMFQYCGLKEYMAAVHNANPVDYLERYRELPQLEMIVKLGLIEVAKKLVESKWNIPDLCLPQATRIDAFLRIRKDKVKLIMKEKGDLTMLKILQAEKRLEQHWSEEQVRNLTEIQADYTKLYTAVQLMTVQKALNRIQKYAGCEFGTGCSRASARLKHTAEIYFDYLAMRQTLGYDLDNTVYQQPRDLEEAHNNMIAESTSAEVDKRLHEVSINYPDIKKKYRALRSRYYYEDDNFVIRPARSAEEIVIEGRILHHCVGGNNYLSKHNTGESTILMLRFKDRESEPYITVEIKEEKIVQWYGAHDKKPDEKNMQKWLNAYTTRLKCERLGIGTRSEDAIMGQLMAYA